MNTHTAVVRNRVARGEDHIIVASRQQVADARSWAADCEWLDSDCLDELTDQQIIRGVDRHYDGGWAQFARDAA